MRIALINENSQAAKNAIIYESLKSVADEKDMRFLIMECMEKMERVN